MFRLQFEAPEYARAQSAVVRWLFRTFGKFDGALVVFSDWPLYEPDEMAIITGLRRGHGDRRNLIDAPGHLFGKHEEAEAIGHCYLALLFGWNVYLYLPSGAVTVQFWEGDLVDVWTGDKQLENSIREVAERFHLQIKP
ncbi:hypothetical protein [Roseimicrobium gellanilyticum]|nr:hypothetical protein [Roseimicrobium gellanilyticum]